MSSVSVALVGDFNTEVVAHRAINESLQLWAEESTSATESVWIHTSELRHGDESRLKRFNRIWCVPASPYAHTDGALWAIEYARTRGVPFLGTCGGFQHAVIEFCRNVLGRSEAGHEELDAASELPVICRLACSLVEQRQFVQATGRGRFAELYGVAPREEGFCCSFGLSAIGERLLAGSGFEIVARSQAGDPRAAELMGESFFIGTLFQPERMALQGRLHPVVRGFLSQTGGGPS